MPIGADLFASHQNTGDQSAAPNTKAGVPQVVAATFKFVPPESQGIHGWDTKGITASVMSGLGSIFTSAKGDKILAAFKSLGAQLSDLASKAGPGNGGPSITGPGDSGAAIAASNGPSLASLVGGGMDFSMISGGGRVDHISAPSTGLPGRSVNAAQGIDI